VVIAAWIDGAGVAAISQLDKAGQGAAVQPPPQLTELRIGYELDHSLANLELPASLRILRFGARWNQTNAAWPPLPGGLEELELPDEFNHPLSSLHLPSSLRKLYFQLYRPFDESASGSVSHLFDDPTPNMFPPQLRSLRLPPPVSLLKEMELQRKVVRGQPAAIVWLGSTPLNLSLLPPSLRFLRIYRAQALVCDPPSLLDSLRLEELSVCHRDSAFPFKTRTKWYEAAEACRQKLRRQMRLSRVVKRATHPARDHIVVGAATGSGATAATLAAASHAAPTEPAATAQPIASVSAASSFTMGTSKRG
jgi:hypothetical protein